MKLSILINTSSTISMHEYNIFFIEYVIQEVKSISNRRLKILIDTLIKECEIPSFRSHRHQILRFKIDGSYDRRTVLKVHGISRHLQKEWSYLWYNFRNEQN